jgi:replicative DNA helicase
MAAIQLAQRITSIDSSITLTRLTKGRMTTPDFMQLNTATGRLEKLPIVIIDNLTDWRQIRQKITRLNHLGKCGMVFIDYLQLCELNGAGNREQEISKISRQMKQMAKELNIPVIALSQLSRKVEERGDKRPMLSDLRESGGIEQDADVVEFIYRPEYYGIKDIEGFDTTSGLAMCIVAKHRNGALDEIPMRFEPQFTRMSNWGQEFPTFESALRPNCGFEDEDEEMAFEL